MGNPDDDRYVSKPFEADLNVLCVDGTRPTDSAAFFHYLKAAGMRIKNKDDRVAIQNLLSLAGKEMSGTINGPGGAQKSSKLGDGLADMDHDSKVFPFGPGDLKTLPIKKTSLPGQRDRIAHVLLPQGEVSGSKTTYTDSILGATSEARRKAAERNSELLMRLCLAPGISDVDSPSAYLDFATSSNAKADIIYLSGHGSMSGTISGEADEYMKYFQMLKLVTPEFESIAGSGALPPYWMVTGACFSMRRAHAEIWLRFFRKQSVPLRGILGYQTTSPLADASAEINRRFAQALSEGKTFIKAWQKANGGNDGWTALAFDYAENDTLTSLRDLKRTGTQSVPPAGARSLLFFDQRLREEVKIEPPPGLLEVFVWEKNFATMMLDPDDPSPEPEPPPGGFWNKLLVTNYDFTRESFETAAASSDGKYVSNDSWRTSKPRNRLIDLGGWDHTFCAGRIYGVLVFPPFTEDFKNGFQTGDEIELSVVHVRQDYPKPVAFRSIFDVLQINGHEHPDFKIPPPNSALGKVQAARVSNRVRFACPTGESGFEPARIAVRYRKEAGAQNYLWFWFAVRIERQGAAIFKKDFDTFVLEAGSAHHCGPLERDYPSLDRDVWPQTF